MGASLADLDQRDIARLRAEIGEEIAARFTYPPFFDYHAGRLRVRPIEAAKRREIAGFVQAIILEPIAQADVSSSDVRRFLEALFLRYLELNPALSRGPTRRRLSSIRVEVPRAAADVQRGLVALAAGAPGNFGAPRPLAAWEASDNRPGQRPLPWERIERDTELVASALLRRPDEPEPAFGGASAPSGSGTASQWTAAARPSRPANPPSWADIPIDGTAPLPTARVRSDRSPFADLAAGSQSAMFGASASVSMSEQPTGPQPIVGLGSVAPAAPREPPPELLELYSQYLHDLQPEASPTAPAGNGAYGSPPHDADGWSSPSPNGPPSRPPSLADVKTDRLIFEQLRHQLDAYIRLAARSYGVRARGSDPASAIDALRRSGHVDEADLRIAESILAISDRVSSGGASVEDYRQAFMLYLLYHRGRIGT